MPADWPLLPFVGYQPSVMFTEGAEHQRRAGAIGDALAAVDQFELRPHCQRIADGLIDAFAGSRRGGPDRRSTRNQMPMLAVVRSCAACPTAEDPEQLVRDLAISLDAGRRTRSPRTCGCRSAWRDW